ncbi:MAG: maleylacetoacetate isomerase [Pseudomonadota bacterium]
MKLYSYWRSTTSYRVRIALAWKGIDYEYIPVNLVEGEQRDADYAALNPVMGVPTLQLSGGQLLTQSLAILDFLEIGYPAPPLLPGDPYERAKVRAAALVMATDTHPVNNLKVGQKLKAMGHSQDEVVAWMNHWTGEGLTAFQALIRDDTEFAFGENPTWADVCLVGQLYNAHRWGADLSSHGRLLEIEASCLALHQFQAAHPDNQPDAS